MIKFVKEGFDTATSKPIKIGEVIDLGKTRNKSAVERGLAIEVKDKK